MMKKLLFALLLFSVAACRQGHDRADRTRQPVDTVGFATKAWQMDSLMHRIEREYAEAIDSLNRSAGIADSTPWRVAISPHDDYTYVGPLYPSVLGHVKAQTVFLFGVAHKAAQLGLENKLVFESFPAWLTPYGEKNISKVRNELIGRLPSSVYTVNDSMQALEHSLEALVPILQYFNKDVEFIPILVPYMSYDRMDSIAVPFSEALSGLINEKGWKWGKDFSFLISNDAVHYGDEGWDGKNYAPFGVDSSGYELAVDYEEEIIDSCLIGPVEPGKLKLFTHYTLQEENYRVYKWTWCGRYSVPFGLLTAWHLQHLLKAPPLDGVRVGYMTSIDHAQIPVNDLGMGTTAPANLRHWVGYAAIGYR